MSNPLVEKIEQESLFGLCDGPTVSMQGTDSVQTTVTSLAASEFLCQSRDTVSTDDEGSSVHQNDRRLASGLTVHATSAGVCSAPDITASGIPVTFINSPNHPADSLFLTSSPSKQCEIATDDDCSVQSTMPAVLEVPAPSFVAPDGGWGWVIVIVSFLCSAVVDGLCSVFGVLLPSLVLHFDGSSSTVAFAGSMLAGGFLLFGPVGSLLINCFGCRATTIIGGLVSAISLVSSPFSPSVTVFILLFGGLGGFGASLIYLPANVMVGYYFERKRGIAAGIASSGAGFGMLVLSPLAAWLEYEYTWKGALTLLAGVSINCLVCGALMRPLAEKKERNGEKVNSNFNEESEFTEDTRTVIVTSRQKNRLFAVRTARMHQSKSKQTMEESCLQLATQLVSGSVADMKQQSLTNVDASEQVDDTPELSGPLQRKDIFYSGSVVSLHKDPGSAPRRDSMCSNQLADSKPGPVCGRKPAMCTTMCEMLDVGLFRNFSFLVICLASVFIQLGYFVPVVFITPYAQTRGLTPSSAALLLSVAGVSNMIGRAGAGALATVPCVKILHFNCLSLIITGLSTALVTLVCVDFASLIVYSVVFGLAVAVFVPLTTIFLVQFVGLNKLTNAYGLLSMVKGIATMIGPPVAGALYDSTQTYSSTFYFAGSMFVIAGLLFYLLPLTQKRKQRLSCLAV